MTPRASLHHQAQPGSALRGRVDRSGSEDRTGAKRFPPALTGGESPLEGRRGAKVDWCTVTWRPEPDEHVGAMVHDLLCGLIGGVLGEDVNGMLGYERGVRFYIPVNGTPVPVARVDWGGQHHGGRARLDISGSGCSKLANWMHLRDWIEQLEEPTLTRVDLAVDCLMGEFTVEDARDWYLAGEFNAGGRMPRHSTPGDWLDPKYGRTLEVGRRENGKMLRAYEKGRQLGDTSSPWTRFEVELRNKDRDLPFDVLTDCDKYFAGAYRCLEKLLDVAAERIATHQKEGEISVERLTHFARVSYGQLVDVLRVRLTAQEIVEEISRPGIPRRLEKASLAGFNNAAPPAAPAS